MKVHSSLEIEKKNTVTFPISIFIYKLDAQLYEFITVLLVVVSSRLREVNAMGRRRCGLNSFLFYAQLINKYLIISCMEFMLEVCTF